MAKESEVKTRDSYVLEPVGYEALQRRMSWAGLRYGDPELSRYATGEVDGRVPEFPWQEYSQVGADKAHRARGLRVGRQR